MMRVLSMAILLLSVAFTSAQLQADEVRTLEWTDLMPEEDLALLESLPDIEHDYSQPSPFDDASDDPYASLWQQVLSSAKVREEFNNQRVRLPGFIVPLEFDQNQNVTSFFLVPYFGACIHVPPPPPNQIIYVTEAKGLTADMMYTPFWITGILTTDSMNHDLAFAAYSIKADHIEEYSW
ncbi:MULTISPECIES: DUF3299 domain-containing protein [Alkalimonas]|uniref:DUF3299 domain-containing protein n=1 Tax=Alkalimonas mucilaginosa TaxID=3057676 RepID=A0ABU7JI18_9GAMM|nr:DUF3299 domain-containing protein [Alkalimonas sp. MEB004]MEE2024638.1 DUF3299 domain-containing protein [Alkalimonas sp. MEB004]